VLDLNKAGTKAGTMSGPSETPASARRRVRLAVRRGREAKGWTQTHVAEEMEWSLSKVMRIESGEVTIAPNDLRPLLTFLGIRDKATVDGLVASAKLSKQRRQWWDSPELREGFTPALKQLVQLEPDATAIRYFYPLILPARFQTPAYSAAILDSFRGGVSDEIIKARLAIRAARRERFLNDSRPTTLYTILDESVLLRQTGGKQVLVEQLLEIVRIAEAPQVRLRIIPLSHKAAVATMGLYEIVYLGEEGDEENAVLYRESDLVDELIDDADNIRRHRSQFERLWNTIYEEPASNELLRQRLKDLR
jgi:transcriptional regulator with XRE-family HTH domain